MNIPPLLETSVSNLEFELWLAGSSAALPTIHQQGGSYVFFLSMRLATCYFGWYFLSFVIQFFASVLFTVNQN
jgi:hypothetical protein